MTTTSPVHASAEIWASQVAAHAVLPDQRLNARFAQILMAFAAKPLDSIPQASATPSEAKATYRFLSNNRVLPSKLLAPLVATTVDSCHGCPVILSIQDTTSLNYTALTTTTGLGALNDSPRAKGLHLHTTMATDLNGVPLGLLHQHYWSRSNQPIPDPDHRPIEEKESYKWLRGIEAATKALSSLPEAVRPRLIHVMDREGDIHEVLQEISERGHGGVIRCAQNRSVSGDIDKAHQAVAASVSLGTTTLDVPGTQKQPSRIARVELRATPLTITPDRKKHPHREPVTWTLIEVREIAPPAGVEPLRWLLWTTEAAENLEQILEVLRLYKLRWRVEDFHLTLKSGCRAEALELERAVRLIRALTIYSAVAVRIVAMRDLARVEPDAPCTRIVSDVAWKALWTYIHKQAPSSMTAVPTIRQVIRWIGRLGGHLGRKCDGMPGVRTLWRGWRDLTLLIAGYRAAQTQG
jgi:hypothetical protein